MLKTLLPMERAWVPSLAGELRPHIPHGMAKNKQAKEITKKEMDSTGQQSHQTARGRTSTLGGYCSLDYLC